MARVNYETLGKLIEVDEKDLEFERVTNSIDVVDREYGVEVIFDYYRRHGFPHYKIREEEKHDHLNKLRKFDVDTIFKDSQIIQTMHGLRLCWTYHPHFWEVRCGSAKKSPMEIFLDDDMFKSTIRKCWNWEQKHYKGEDPNGERNVFHENRLRQSIKIYSGTQSVSNFRPTAAKLIYEKYAGDGAVWDMSCGWGGRLLGFLSAKNTKHYIGTEPSTKTFDGLKRMSKDFDYINKKVDIYKQGSETFRPESESLDLCFTSPPYFDTEKYSDEESQSYKKFPAQDEWVNGFLKTTIKNCYHGLKKGGYMLYNIANTPKYKFIEEETQRISTSLGFIQEETIQLTLSSVMGAGHKYEPIFVFRKGD